MQSRNVDQITFNPAFIIVIFLVVLVVVVGARSYKVVNPGEVALVLRLGKLTGDVHEEGMLWRIPFIDEVEIVSIETHKLLVGAKAVSKDLQSVDSEIVLNYRPITSEIPKIYRKFRKNYEDRVITPDLHESFKSVTAGFNAEELITKRQQVKNGVIENIKLKLHEWGFKLEALSIQDFRFSPEYARAIEMKQVAEQDALRAENEYNKVVTEQKQQVAKAKAAAEALTIQATAEANAVEIRAKAEAKALELLAKVAKPAALQARTIEKWDGILPRVTGGTVPFIDVAKQANLK